MIIEKDNARTTAIQLVKYGIIGLSNTLITLVVFYLMNTRMGLPYGVSNVVGYVLGVINSFVWNRKWVFKSNTHLRREMALFGVGFGLCLGLQLMCSYFMLEVMGMKDIEIAWLPMKKPGQNIVMVIAMAIYTLANYVYNRLITFKE